MPGGGVCAGRPEDVGIRGPAGACSGGATNLRGRGEQVFEQRQRGILLHQRVEEPLGLQAVGCGDDQRGDGIGVDVGADPSAAPGCV